MPETPKVAAVGQMWKDNDSRSKGEGEMVVVAAMADRDGHLTMELAMSEEECDRVRSIVTRASKDPRNFPLVVVRKTATGHFRRVSQERLLKHGNRQTGYTYLGRAR